MASRLHRPDLLIVLALGVALTAWLASSLRSAAARDDAHHFERLATKVRDLLAARVGIYVYGLRGSRGVFAASVEVTREEFAAYAASRDPLHEFPGAIGIGFIRREAGPRYVIDYVEPAELNRDAIGFDIATDRTRREAAERAMRTGEPSLTAPVTLVQAPGEGPGVLYLLPVYRPGLAIDSPGAREDALMGWTYMPIVVGRAVAGVADIADGQLDFEIFDGTPESGVLIHAGAGRRDAEGREAHDMAHGDRALTSRDALAIGGRTWTLLTRANARFESASRLAAWLVLVGGLVLTALLVLLLGNLAATSRRAEAMAAAMTVDLQAKSQELLRLSLHDNLTGLPNRALLYDRMQQAILMARREPRCFALMFLDVDDFKRINDTFGHAGGDTLLRTFAERLRSAVRASDSVGQLGRSSTVARVGGDEFVVFLLGLAHRDDVHAIAARLVKLLADPVAIGDRTVVVAASVGVVVGEARHLTPDDLVADADVAMYQAKARGKGCYALFGEPRSEPQRDAPDQK